MATYKVLSKIIRSILKGFDEEQEEMNGNKKRYSRIEENFRNQSITINKLLEYLLIKNTYKVNISIIIEQLTKNRLNDFIRKLGKFFQIC